MRLKDNYDLEANTEIRNIPIEYKKTIFNDKNVRGVSPLEKYRKK